MDETVCRFAFLSLYPSSFSLLPFPRIPYIPVLLCCCALYSLGGALFFLSTKAKSGGSLCLFVELLANGASRMDRISARPFLPPPTSLSLQNTTPRTHCSPFPAFDCFSIVSFSQHRPKDCHGDACVPRPWCWRAGDPLSIVLRVCCPVPFKVCVQSQLLAGG